MRRILVFVTLLAVTLGGVGGAAIVSTRAAAQDESTPAATHPIVGMWWWQNISTDPFDDSFAVFGADGTYVEETPYIGAGIGAWVPTGERTADLLIVYQDIEGGLDPQAPAAFKPGTITMHLAVTIDPSGKSLVASGPLEIRSPDGTLLDELTYDFHASRVTVDWSMPAPPATPVASSGVQVVAG